MCRQQRWDFFNMHAVWHYVKARSFEIRRILKIDKLLWIERSLLHWSVHVSRTSQERLTRQVLLATPTGKRPRGRPTTRWSDYISDLSWSRFVVEPAELCENAVESILSPHRAADPAIVTRRKMSIKLKREWMETKWVNAYIFRTRLKILNVMAKLRAVQRSYCSDNL